MTTRHALGRHRATPVRTNPLESISKAVSSNAGSVGRQAAVIAAASGLVLSIGVPAQATPATREADKAPVSDVLQADLVAKKASVQGTVKVAAAKKKDAPVVKVRSIKSATDGADYRAAQKAEREAAEKAAAERREAAQEAAAERQEAAQEAAAERRQAAAASNSTSSSNSSSSNTSSSNSSSNNASSGNTSSTSSNVTKKETKTAPSTGNSSIASMAKQYIGSPYVFGGSTPGGWDCSGFVQYIYGKAGVSLPHNAAAQRASGKLVRTSSPKPGDLVFQSNDSHVGIYIGGGKMVGAQNPKAGTVIRDTTGPYAAPLVGYYTIAG
ncbi:MAG: C40 family peptidase [Arthrobacter sp.]|uniref:C40 family peptidase n=1 Tax=unclassified Arthrobacter TaxID=235627 RepID=UPI00264E57B2|nr:C40 family peptidase [Micrococcaceae bacterium]MDN5812778.1 C40 family peptidase [Micrococcaceae bacterium]MDN5879653.1 C40 family peptidase [Micrococcaceae bacterium]MDN5887532.1 C40 family peptidase [Micrococcaceae bacterium]MDN6332615.1 C40 family peptidase [Micrococcaceae bacterium]